jgi:molybdopterin/thiamine biosynthesis adenylyltransferase
MILSQPQTVRYKRHLIMPEIGESGQKKLLESTVAVVGSSAESAAPLLYYLACSGIGKLRLSFDNEQNLAQITENLSDLNPDIKIDKCSHNSEENISVKIILGNKTFISKILEDTISSKRCDPIPVLIVHQDSWSGIIYSIYKQEDISSLNLSEDDVMPRLFDNELYDIGNVISSCFAGALVSIETIKLCLNLGGFPRHSFSFDLFNMIFTQNQKRKPLTSNYFYLNNAASMKDITKAKALIVGTGGLGSPAAYALASTGIGTIGILDCDTIELSNLNRQILHSTSRIGISKVKSAEMFLKQLNPDVNIKMYHTLLTSANVEKIIKDFDMVVSAVDNLGTRYILNDACYFLRKPLAEAGVLRFEGLGFTIVPDKSPCYRCLFPSSSEVSSGAGILGPVPGVMGFIQAAETVKILLGIGNTLENRLILYNALKTEFRTLSSKRNPKCQLCGLSPSINSIEEYDFRRI